MTERHFAVPHRYRKGLLHDGCVFLLNIAPSAEE